MCAANLITITTAGNGAKAMDGDVTDVTGACAVRTFTCLGTVTNMPNIEVTILHNFLNINKTIVQLNNGQGVITDGSDGATDGSTMLLLTCNAAGTAWESNGVAITQVECAVTPRTFFSLRNTLELCKIPLDMSCAQSKKTRGTYKRKKVVECLMCAANVIMVTTVGVGAKAMDGDVTDTTGVCAVRTFTCLGTSPNIEV